MVGDQQCSWSVPGITKAGVRTLGSAAGATAAPEAPSYGLHVASHRTSNLRQHEMTMMKGPYEDRSYLADKDAPTTVTEDALPKAQALSLDGG